MMETATIGRLRALVIDSQRNGADGLAGLLRRQGHQVESAFDVEQAVRRIREQEFDLAFFDAMHGVAAIDKALRARPKLRIVVVGNRAERELLDRAFEHGAYGALLKPVGMNEVKSVADRARSAGVVLIADDDRTFSATIKKALEARGYITLLAESGTQTMEMILDGGIDALVLDLQLPGLSGLEVYSELHKRGRTIPTVVVTGNVAEEASAIHTFHGVHEAGVLTKPFAIEALFAQIKLATAMKNAPALPSPEAVKESAVAATVQTAGAAQPPRPEASGEASRAKRFLVPRPAQPAAAARPAPPKRQIPSEPAAPPVAPAPLSRERTLVTGPVSPAASAEPETAEAMPEPEARGVGDREAGKGSRVPPGTRVKVVPGR